MEASRALISQIFSRGRLLEIPFYQRAYVWGEEQWARLIDDMEFVTKTKRSYFSGLSIKQFYENMIYGDLLKEWQRKNKQYLI